MKRFVAGADRAQSTLLPECLDKVATEMALHVLAYNVFGVKPFVAAVRA